MRGESESRFTAILLVYAIHLQFKTIDAEVSGLVCRKTDPMHYIILCLHLRTNIEYKFIIKM